MHGFPQALRKVVMETTLAMENPPLVDIGIEPIEKGRNSWNFHCCLFAKGYMEKLIPNRQVATFPPAENENEDNEKSLSRCLLTRHPL